MKMQVNLLGSESAAVWESCAKGASLCNELAMRYLDTAHYDACVEMLDKAEVMAASKTATPTTTTTTMTTTTTTTCTTAGKPRVA